MADRIKMPETTERTQRRDDFRLIAPMGARFHFTPGADRKLVKMIDLSAGGASGLLISLKDGAQQAPPVKIGQTILNLKLAFTTDGKTIFIPIRESVVRRIENLPQKGRYLMAVAFVRMDKKHKAQLKEILYNEQRHELIIRQQRS